MPRRLLHRFFWCWTRRTLQENYSASGMMRYIFLDKISRRVLSPPSFLVRFLQRERTTECIFRWRDNMQHRPRTTRESGPFGAPLSRHRVNIFSSPQGSCFVTPEILFLFYVDASSPIVLAKHKRTTTNTPRRSFYSSKVENTFKNDRDPESHSGGA